MSSGRKLAEAHRDEFSNSFEICKEEKDGNSSSNHRVLKTRARLNQESEKTVAKGPTSKSASLQECSQSDHSNQDQQQERF